MDQDTGDDVAKPEPRHGHDTELERGTCLRLLATKTIGRVIYTRDALPAVQPVRYLLDGETIVFASSEATHILGARHGTILAFEVDELDPDTGAGWVVTAVGSASTLCSAEAGSYCPTALRPLAGDGDTVDVVAMTSDILTGHRVTG